MLSLFSSRVLARCCRSAVFASKTSTEDLDGDEVLLAFDTGESGDAPLLATVLFSFGERLGRGLGPRSPSGGVPSFGVEVVGGEGDNHQNSPPLPL